MTSKREEIMQAIMTLLASVDGVDDRIYRSRVDALRREDTPAIVVEQISTTASEPNLDYLDWILQFRVVVITRGDIPDALADPVISSLYGLIMADRELGGKAIDLVPVSMSFQKHDGDQSVGISECVFECKHRTSATDIGA